MWGSSLWPGDQRPFSGWCELWGLRAPPPTTIFWAVLSRPQMVSAFCRGRGGAGPCVGFSSAHELGRGTGSFQIPVLDCPLSRV